MTASADSYPYRYLHASADTEFVTRGRTRSVVTEALCSRWGRHHCVTELFEGFEPPQVGDRSLTRQLAKGTVAGLNDVGRFSSGQTKVQ